MLSLLLAVFSMPAGALPTVTLTSPTASQVFPAPGAVTLRATATPTSGSTITRVEFYRGASILIGTVSGSSTPHTLNWNNVAAGAYSITARAFDSTGNRTSSAVAMTVRTPPTVSLSAPAAGATFAAGANIPVSATASAASGGTVSNVKFFRDTTQIGANDTSSPYSVTWNGATAGTYSLTAVVTDSTGLITTSAARSITVNPPPPPTVSLTAPANGATFAAGANVTLSATATPGSGTLTHVRFQQNGVQIGSPDTSSPYSITWSSVPAGTYAITAVARNSGGAETTSAVRTITVNAPPAPTVALTAPSDGATFAPGSSIALSATATAGTGTLTHVRFEQNGVAIGSPDTTSPYGVSWANVPSGNYAITAIARNSGGAETRSAPRNVVVSVPHAAPTATLTAPASGALYQSPATIQLAATAATTQPGATIARVEFYNGTAKIGEATSAPYTFTWSNRPTGTYYLRAVAVDNANFTGASPYVAAVVDGTDSCTDAPPLAAAPSAEKLAAFEGPSPNFEENRGQFHEAVRFRRNAGGYQLYLTPSERVVAIPAEGASARAIALRMRFLDSNPGAEITGAEPLAARSHYLAGRDPAKWRSHVRNFAAVRYHGIYPGIDEVYRAAAGGLEYDLHVTAGADPAAVRFAIEGAERAELTPDGDLVLHTEGGGRFIHRKPVAFQEIDGERRAVTASYRRISEREFGFEVADYDSSRTLVIDPVLVYSTLVGGRFGDTWAKGVALSRCGEIYITGHTQSTEFPTTAGAFDTVGDPSSFMGFVSKLNPSGTGLMYSTYLTGVTRNPNTGSNGQISEPQAIALDATGHAYVAGATEAEDFPTTPFSWMPARPQDESAFVAKLNSDGSGLIYSTYVPVGYLTSIAVDASNNAYFAGSGIVWKLNPQGTAPLWQSNVAVGAENILGIAVDAAGSAFVVGSTSNGALAPTPGVLQPTRPNSSPRTAAWIAKLRPDGSLPPVYATYIGTTRDSVASAVALDAQGNAYVTGYSQPDTVPGYTGAYTMFSNDSRLVGGFYGFVTKVDPNGTQLGFYTSFGGTQCSGNCFNADTTPRAIALAPDGSIWFAGGSSSNQLTLKRQLYSSGLAFAAKLGPSGTTLDFSTFLDGVATGFYDSQIVGIQVDSTGAAYIAGSTTRPDFPTTAGAFQATPRQSGLRNAFVTKIVENRDSATTLSVSPASGTLGTPATLTATVTGNSPTGNVVFRDGSTLLGNAALSGGSAQFVATTLAVGPHSFTAAYEGDARNVPSTSAAVPYAVADPAAPPTIAFTGWSDGQVLVANNGTYYTGGQFGLTMSAAYGNTIAQYTLYLDNTPNQRTINLASYTTTTSLPDMQIGTHAMRAVATDNRGNRATALLRFVVNPSSSPTGPANVAITAPANGASIVGNVTMQATADATATSMDYYADGTYVAFASTPPFTATWTNPPAGTYSLAAVARNNNNAGRVSAPITVTVRAAPAVPPPTVSLTSPTGGQTFTSPPSIALAASASAGSGASLAKVEFYDGATLLGTVMSPPYQLTWTTAAVGSHVLRASATDSLGQTTQSANVSITVTSQPTLSATLDPGIDGSSVHADTVLVSGRVQAPRNSGVTVNGNLAVLTPAGDFFVNDVPLVQGANTITITVTTQDGETSSSTLTVNRLGPSPVVVKTFGDEGLPNLEVRIETANPGGLPIATVEIDLNDDGVPEYVAQSTGSLSLPAQLQGPGLMRPRVTFKDAQGGVLHTVSRRAFIWTGPQLAAIVKGVFTDMIERLKAGNSALAANVVAPSVRASYGAVFDALGPDLPAFAQQIGTLDSLTASTRDAEATILRDSSSGRQAFFIYLIRGGDGIWRIEAM